MSHVEPIIAHSGLLLVLLGPGPYLTWGQKSVTKPLLWPGLAPASRALPKAMKPGSLRVKERAGIRNKLSINTQGGCGSPPGRFFGVPVRRPRTMVLGLYGPPLPALRCLSPEGRLGLLTGSFKLLLQSFGL